MTKLKEKTKTLEEILSEEGIDSSSDNVAKLVLWNDDVNSFEWVILNLMMVLNFSQDKAEKSAWTVHNKGKCIIKDGSVDELTPYKDILQERGLTLTIEKN